MEALKEIIYGGRLAGVIDLPESFKTSELEVIILPLRKETKKKSPGKTQGRSVKLEDLPRHKMGKELIKVDRAHIYNNER